jgi:hypothetical protein
MQMTLTVEAVFVDVSLEAFDKLLQIFTNRIYIYIRSNTNVRRI